MTLPAHLVDDAESRSDGILFVHKNDAHKPLAVVRMTEEFILSGIRAVRTMCT